MARRWVVSNGSNAIEMSTAKVAVGGVVKPITKAIVAHEGINRQYWPPTASTGDPRIVWNSDARSVNQSVLHPYDSYATITFTRASGMFSHPFYPQADQSGTFLSPALDGSAGDDGKYLIRVDQTSGAVLTGTLATWIDLNSAATLSWSLDQLDIGSSTATADISISQDDGGGSPVAATTVVKEVLFNSEVRPNTGGTNIIWTTLQRDLVEIKESVDATCDLTFNPAGFAVGSADTSGSFNEDWHFDAPTVLDPENYTVEVTLISGTAPSGSSLATPLTLDAVRNWQLLATTGEDLSCELDVTVDDLVPAGNDVTKRVTMNSVRNTPIDDPAWTTTPWSCTDAGFEQGTALEVFVYVTFDTDGTAKLEMETFAMPRTEFDSEDWFDTPPPLAGDLNNYEIKLDYVSGAGIAPPLEFGVWYRMTEIREFTVLYTTRVVQRVYELTASVRKVGGLATDKPITVTVIKSDGTFP